MFKTSGNKLLASWMVLLLMVSSISLIPKVARAGGESAVAKPKCTGAPCNAPTINGDCSGLGGGVCVP